MVAFRSSRAPSDKNGGRKLPDPYGTWADQVVALWRPVTAAHAAAGSAVDAIVDTAASVGADLVVVGSKGMRGARRVLGSVPNSVAHRARCAVLIVKTD